MLVNCGSEFTSDGRMLPFLSFDTVSSGEVIPGVTLGIDASDDISPVTLLKLLRLVRIWSGSLLESNSIAHFSLAACFDRQMKCQFAYLLLRLAGTLRVRVVRVVRCL